MKQELLIVMLSLGLFGIIYNAFTDWIERHGHDRGITSLLVVVGVIVTLAGALTLIGLDSVIILAFCFVASGTPMIVGSLARYARRQARIEALLRKNALNYLEEND